MNQAARNAVNTIYDAKRLIGRRYTDRQVEEDKQLWPFTLVDSGNNRPQYLLNVDGQEIRMHPEEISAKVLEKVKLFAERRI